MKKKPIAEPIISPEILDLDKKSVKTKRAAVSSPCAVCGSICTPLTGPQSSDDLCWICRRLKISAWRESDGQMTAHE